MQMAILEKEIIYNNMHIKYVAKKKTHQKVKMKI